MSLVKWRTGKNDKNLTDKLKIADMAKDHKKVHWNLIETRWDVPCQMANLTKMMNPAETEKTCQEGERCESGRKNHQGIDATSNEARKDFLVK